MDMEAIKKGIKGKVSMEKQKQMGSSLVHGVQGDTGRKAEQLTPVRAHLHPLQAPWE